MSLARPILRQARRVDFNAQPGQVVFSAGQFPVWHVADVAVWTRSAGDTQWTRLTSGWTASASETGVTVSLAVAPRVSSADPAILVRIESRRVDERPDDVTRAGAVRSLAMELRHDQIATVNQELRRDIDDACEGLAIERAATSALSLRLDDVAAGSVDLQTRVSQIELLSPGSTPAQYASAAEAAAGVSTTKLISPSTLSGAISARLASQPEAYAGADIVKLMSPARTLDALRDYAVDLRRFGAIGDGAAHPLSERYATLAAAQAIYPHVTALTQSIDWAALQLAVNTVSARGGGRILAKDGRYVISSPVTWARFVRLDGCGDSTIFQPIFAGVLFNLDLTAYAPTPGSPLARAAFHRFRVDCVAQAGVTALSFTHCRHVRVSDITFSGCEINIYADRGRKHSWKSLFSEGTATLKAGRFVMTSADAADYIFEAHIRDIHFTNNYITGVQSPCMTFRRCALVLCSDVTLNDGWQGSPGSVFLVVENDCQGCKFSRFVASAMGTGVIVQAGAPPMVAPIYCSFTDIDIDQAQNAAMLIDAGSFNKFVNCSFSSSGIAPNITAVVVRNGATRNLFHGLVIGDYALGQGMDITGAAQNSVIACLFTTCANGIVIGPNATKTLIAENHFDLCTNSIIGQPAQAGIAIKNNIGHRQTANLAPALPASGAVTTNNSGYSVTVYVSGGTVSVIAINGAYSNLTSGSFRLDPGDSIQITYSAAPNWTWAPSWS